jgi:hypothetical protein
LRKEKIKWDDSIKAAVIATEFCCKQENPVTRLLLKDELAKHGYGKPGKISDFVLEKIWKALPQKYRSTGGRPLKKN